MQEFEMRKEAAEAAKAKKASERQVLPPYRYDLAKKQKSQFETTPEL